MRFLQTSYVAVRTERLESVLSLVSMAIGQIVYNLVCSALVVFLVSTKMRMSR
jgi:hypothetical protein